MRKVVLLSILAGAALFAVLIPRVPRSSTPLTQEAYVWQRSWNDAVLASVGEHASGFHRLVVLAAEVSFDDDVPRVARIALNTEVLRGREVGLAIRIGPYRANFDAEPTLALLTDLVRSTVRDATTSGVNVVELQIDFDCATSKLRHYQSWVSALKLAAAPVPMCITALPSWINSSEFAPLAQAAGAFVLQVHSLQKPTADMLSPPLCDTDAAKRWTERAAKIGVPFRVALPTYGYIAAYDTHARLLGIVAENELRDHIAAATIQEIRADPKTMAHLVTTWTRDRPSLMQGIIWYRLPTDRDVLNWSWPTLAAVMHGDAPAPRLELSTRSEVPELVEVFARNAGNADLVLPRIAVEWSRGTLTASDALTSFSQTRVASTQLQLQPPDAVVRLKPGEQVQLAWLRFAHATEVSLHEN